MRTIYNVIMTALGVMVLVGAVVFGMDRELARREYVRRVQMQEFEQPIIGCTYDYNCKYYTELLWSALD